MAVKNNPINYYTNDGWVITSDPNWFKEYGKRNLFAYGKDVDAYCGMHRAYDLAKYHNASIKSFANATVLAGTGWNTFGWTLVLGFIDDKGKKWQVIMGHLNRNPLLDFKVGQNVKKGQVVAYQGTSNNLGVSMASHLHIQFQEYRALNEWDFTCLGWDPLNIDISSTKPTSGSVTTSKAPKPAEKVTTVKVSPSNFDKRRGRKTRSKAFAKGIVQSTNGRGAALRRWSKGTFKNTFGPDLPDGSIVYIFATTDTGWAKVYSPDNKGWVHLDQVKITEVY